MKLKIINNINQFVQKNATAMDRGLARAAVDIERLAKAKVPVDKGQLKASGRHIKVGFMKYRTEFNKEYAAFQEFGGDSTRTVRKYTTPGTGKFFLKNAGDTVKGRILGYFKQEARTIKV